MNERKGQKKKQEKYVRHITNPFINIELHLVLFIYFFPGSDYT